MAAGGGGRAYLRRQDRGRTQATPEKLQNRSAAPGSSGRGGAAGEGAGCGGEEAVLLLPAAGHPAVSLQVEGAAGRREPPLCRPAAHRRRGRRVARAAGRAGLRLAGLQPAASGETAAATRVGELLGRAPGQPQE